MANRVKGDHLYVELSSSQTRRRLRGHGFGVRKVETAGRNRALIIHTATGQHLRELKILFGDVLSPAPAIDADFPHEQPCEVQPTF